MKHDVLEGSPGLSPALIAEARRSARQTGRRVLTVLEETTALSADAFVSSLGEMLRYPTLNMSALNQLEPAFDVLPFGEASKRECLVLRDGNGELIIAFADPFQDGVQEWIEARVQAAAQWYLVHQADLAAYLARREESMHAMESLLANAREGDRHTSGIEDLSLKTISAHTSPVVKLVQSTMYDALKANASDIHLESEQNGLLIKYRIDGVLSQIGSIDGSENAEQVVSRIKVMAELDIAERRVPQDGRFKVAIQGREVDFRVSVMPSIFGEDVVLRILDRRALSDQLQGLRLDHLGFDDTTIAAVRKLAQEPYGMLLVTGPTGSGKTTTLYAVISEINHGTDKIITIEDPVEYQLPRVLQIPVNEKKGLTFARGLRSILRHDPDKIMVGEIRDTETAQIAVQSALTGHLVFTTVHANNVFDVIGRFLHMQVDPYSFVSALNGVLAQRLLRVVCPHCRESYEPETQLLASSGLSPEMAEQFHFVRGTGCGQCRGTGYKGRKAIAEILNLDDDIREMIATRVPIKAIKDAARRNGTRLLRESALDSVRRGETTLEEINRVTFVA
ncbi:MAG TPA: GspE/PulE family protein [Burkholderiales bacterium]|nr:GspE/PulE family protein [Burkholderiales bacterium]